MKKVAVAAVLAALVGLSGAFGQSKALDALWTTSTKAYPEAGKFQKPLAWAPGQYVVVGQLAKGKRDSVSKTLVVRKEAGGWVIENSSVDKAGKESVMQMCLGNYDAAMKAGDGSMIELVWIKTLEKDGSVSTTEGPALAMMKTMMKSTYEKMVVSLSEYVEGGAVQVPAGSFSGTNVVKAKTKVMGFNIETESWFHPAVPVNGMVKSRTTDDKSFSELISFGFDGKPRIP
ncbi:MAG TPA: hypothetical protein P5165_02050 [Spirochaetia bacterium]|nr:hypothetical protein [Spirochaetia bacterium]